MKLLYQGSVKSVYDAGQENLFEYTDKYSVFDWGSMPDEISSKGASLALMGGALFEMLGTPKSWSEWESPIGGKLYERFCGEGISHHFLGAVSDKNNQMRVKKINIMHPTPIVQGGQMHLDYDGFRQNPVDTLVPLEVIFRFGITSGSSLLNRMGDKHYLKEIGAPLDFKEDDRLNLPIIEFSTKLEESDRYLSYQEATEIAGLVTEEFEELKEYTTLLALRLRHFFNECEIDLIDGKFEFAFVARSDKRSFMLVDSIGPDELRLIYKGHQLSKECLRQFYRNSSWYHAVIEAKKEARRQGLLDWKKICSEVPPACDLELIKKVSAIYMAQTDLYLEKMGRGKFFNGPVLEEIL